ncbi:MAG TPA: hypothetical protein HA362_07300 [Nanoarchaeota archaeon]|nr:hypothetical protein [Nanoarchaeota archaeon]
MKFNNPRLDELMRHASDCVRIGYAFGARDYATKAAICARASGIRFPQARVNGIEAKANVVSRRMEARYAEIEEDYFGRK